MAGHERVVVVGGGLAGAKTVQSLREKGYRGSLTLIGEEQHLPYDRPPLSKDYLQGKAGLEKVVLHPASWYEGNEVDLRLSTRVESLDREDRVVRLAGGDSVPYDGLVLATGSRPRPLDVPGSDLDGVLYLRRLEDSDRIRETFRRVSRVAVVGSGWIGLEVAAAARAAGVDVTVLGTAELPLLHVLGPEMARVFADLHARHGVDLLGGVNVTGLAGVHGRVTGVELDDGVVVPAEAVVVGIGVRPDTALAEAAGLEVDDGVVVDEHLRTSDPDVYAVGDIAHAWHPVLGRRIRVDHWANALNQPAVAADNLLGEPAVYDRAPYFYSDQYELGMEHLGYVGREGYDEVVVRGSTDALEFVAFWLAGGRVLAGMNVNVWDVVEPIRALLGREVDRARLADPDVPLSEV